jgi:type IV pilus assembly protein PilA
MNKNKGFSLVELIVVVAIMAVLVGILAPAYLSYVEKTRRGTDENMAEEVRHTIEVSAAELCVYDELSDGDSFTFTNGQDIATQCAACSPLKDAMDEVYSGKSFDLKSKKYGGSTWHVNISKPTTTGTAALTVTGTW